MLLTGREVEIIAVAVVAIAAALGSRNKWKRKAEHLEDKVRQLEDDLRSSNFQLVESDTRRSNAESKYYRLEDDMKKLCKERWDSLVVDYILNKWDRTFKKQQL